MQNRHGSRVPKPVSYRFHRELETGHPKAPPNFRKEKASPPGGFVVVDPHLQYTSEMVLLRAPPLVLDLQLPLLLFLIPTNMGISLEAVKRKSSRVHLFTFLTLASARLESGVLAPTFRALVTVARIELEVATPTFGEEFLILQFSLPFLEPSQPFCVPLVINGWFQLLLLCAR